MKGASAAATLQLLSIFKRFSGVAAYGSFSSMPRYVDTLKYQVDTQETVTEIGRTHGQTVLNAMSFVVNNQYGLPEWGNFTVKRNEIKDADEVKFVEGIRNGAPANTLNKNIYCKKIKGILFDSKGVTVVSGRGCSMSCRLRMQKCGWYSNLRACLHRLW